MGQFPMPERYAVYILASRKNGTLYIGVTSNLRFVSSNTKHWSCRDLRTAIGSRGWSMSSVILTCTKPLLVKSNSKAGTGLGRSSSSSDQTLIGLISIQLLAECHPQAKRSEGRGSIAPSVCGFPSPPMASPSPAGNDTVEITAASTKTRPGRRAGSTPTRAG
jgi:hypothetical protein